MIRIKCYIKIVFIYMYVLSHTEFCNSKTFTGTQSLKRRCTHSSILRIPINDFTGIPQVAATADVLGGVPRPVQSTDLDK